MTDQLKIKAAPNARKAKIASVKPNAEAASKSAGGKLGALIDMMRRPDGATIDEMTAASGWQAHSVRGAIAGVIKKRLGLTVVSEKKDDGRRYRIETAA